MSSHNWSGFPGPWCLNCGMEPGQSVECPSPGVGLANPCTCPAEEQEIREWAYLTPEYKAWAGVSTRSPEWAD